MSQETKFTPGPWKIRGWFNEPGDGLVMDRDICATNDKLIATAYETPADAALIAAAPCLYAALEMVRDADEDCHKDGLQTIPEIARAKIDRALAKARGES